MSNTKFTVSDDKKTLIMERTFKASRSKLWHAYSDADALAKWFGPIGWETEVKNLDFSEGGEWNYVMKCVDKDQGEWYGQESAGKTVFNKIRPQEFMEYTDYFTDNEGNINKEMPASVTELHFIENEDDTTTLKAETHYESAEDLKQVLEMGMEEGYGQTIDKLADFVKDK